MKVEHINPFIFSTNEAFSTMLGVKISRGKVGVYEHNGPSTRDVTGLIGLSGRAKGMVAMSFPVETAIGITNAILSTNITEVDESVVDAIAEIVNIVAGGAKAKLSGLENPPMTLSLPTVIRGSNVEIDYPTGSTWLEVQFDSELGPFFLQVTLKESESVAPAGGSN